MRELALRRKAGGRAAVAAALVAVAFALVTLMPGSAGAQQAAYTTDLVGANEVPAVDTMATGMFSATIDDAAQTITYTLSVPVIAGATAAHIHQGAAGTNGPVVLALYSSAGENVVDVSATLAAADLAGPLAGDWAGFVAGLADGSLYVNVHTTANAGGEIRGQIAMADIPPPVLDATPVAADTGNAGLVADAGTGTGTAVVLLIAALGAITGGRMLTRRDSGR